MIKFSKVNIRLAMSTLEGKLLLADPETDCTYTCDSNVKFKIETECSTKEPKEAVRKSARLSNL